MIKTWLAEIRANFLVLAVVLVLIGGAAAWNEGVFKPLLFGLTMAGIILAHISVNLFNEYSDWKTGIDAMTNRTPFSGGSGNLQEGRLVPSQVKAASWLTLGVAFLIGLYLAWMSGWQVLLLMGIGGIVTVTYTDHLAKWMLGEFASGITLGSLVVIGAYFVQTGSLSGAVVWASIPPGLLTMGLLYLNEFPDVEADKRGGRKHLVIAMGRKRAAYGYAVIVALVYLTLGAGVVTGGIPGTMLAGFLTLPVAIAAVVRALRNPESHEQMIPALGMNVAVVLATDFLLAVGFILA